MTQATPDGYTLLLSAKAQCRRHKILKEAAVKASIEAQGVNTVGGSPASFQKMIDDDYIASNALVRSAGLRERQ